MMFQLGRDGARGSSGRSVPLPVDVDDQTAGEAPDLERAPKVGDRAPDFLIYAPLGDQLLRLHELASRAGRVVLVSQDSYRYHGT